MSQFGLLRQVEELRRSAENNAQLSQSADNLLAEIGTLKSECARLQTECARLNANLKTAEELLDEVGKSEAEKIELIKGLHKTIDVLSESLVKNEDSSQAHKYAAHPPKTQQAPGKTNFTLLSLKSGENELDWNFSQIQPWPQEYEFMFQRDGMALKAGVPQTISFLPEVTAWFGDVGLEIHKGKLLKQITMGQIPGSSIGEQGLKPIVKTVWEVKIRANGHWRIFLKQVSQGRWVVFHVTDANYPSDELLLRLSADL